MALYVDASALVARHIEGPGRLVARQAMAADSQWCTSALALTEAVVLIAPLAARNA